MQHSESCESAANLQSSSRARVPRDDERGASLPLDWEGRARRDAVRDVLRCEPGRCGILWGAAWCGIDVATAAGISQAVALTVFQGGSILVAGCWGVWLRELFEPRQICLFFIACAWLEAGVVLEMQASPSAPPLGNHTY